LLIEIWLELIFFEAKFKNENGKQRKLPARKSFLRAQALL